MGNGPRTDLDFRNLVVLAVEREALLRKSLADDDRAFDEAIARFLHVDAKAVVFDRRGAAPEAEDRPAARDDIEQCDLLRDLNRVMPWQHDDRGAKLHALRTAGNV